MRLAPDLGGALRENYCSASFLDWSAFHLAIKLTTVICMLLIDVCKVQDRQCNKVLVQRQIIVTILPINMYIYTVDNN